ncbi:hypothetical protein QYE76_010333 [Lolium multiflorum]|uniref:Uncharacterized protein n=1 Tax=Lolium multiflorum TaxID=4521 RepID=A0AAD8TTM0_LOLMU|nr:hypothetical protein QYE76_010333 [Lolium multiflorum]
MNFAVVRCASGSTRYLGMKKTQDWRCLKDGFPSLVVELDGVGFLCPLIWYIAALLYCCKYYNRDPRERPGLCASAFLAIIFTAVTIVTLFVLLIICEHKRFLNGCGSGLKIHNSWLQDIRCISMTNGVLDRNTI